MKNFFKKMGNYSFWVGFSGAVVILLNAFGKAFGFSIENKVVEDCIMAVAGLLVVLGLVVKKNPTVENKDEKNKNEDNSFSKEISDETLDVLPDKIGEELASNLNNSFLKKKEEDVEETDNKKRS
ncbi:MAG: hypothetical protein J6K39_02405 [Clostridia bacterium]|nr:hypothetical protein [Clostridia bacterium]